MEVVSSALLGRHHQHKYWCVKVKRQAFRKNCNFATVSFLLKYSLRMLPFLNFAYILMVNKWLEKEIVGNFFV